MLTNPTGAATGQTTATGSVDADGVGVVRAVVMQESAVAWEQTAPASLGTMLFSADGLAPGVQYAWHFTQSVDAVSAPFATDGIPPPVGLPYPLPVAGEAKAISLNLPNAVKPAGWSDLQWHYTVFGSYGGGTYVQAYSEHGAYVSAGTGGHNHPDHTGAAIFDFSTGLWSRIDCANAGLPTKAPSTAYAMAETNGEPILEITGTEVPTPAHPYQLQCFSPGGARGGVVYVMRAATTIGARPSSCAHRLDLDTRLWSRVSDPGNISWGGSEASAVFDAVRNRWWIVPTAMHYITALPYLDGADMTWKTTPKFPAPPGASAVYSRLMLHDGMLLRNSGSALRLFDPDQPAAGWVQLTVSGTLPIGQNAWARHSDGNWYAYDGAPGAGNVLTRIRPPADPKAGTWTVDTVTVGGDALTHSVSNGDPSGVKHYTRFFYVDALDCLCWVAGANSSVFLIKP